MPPSEEPSSSSSSASLSESELLEEGVTAPTEGFVRERTFEEEFLLGEEEDEGERTVFFFPGPQSKPSAPAALSAARPALLSNPPAQPDMSTQNRRVSETSKRGTGLFSKHLSWNNHSLFNRTQTTRNKPSD